MMKRSKLSKKIIAVLVAIVMVFQYGLGVSEVSAAKNYTMHDDAITGFSIKAYVDNDWKDIRSVAGAIKRGTKIQVSINYAPDKIADKFQVNDKISYTLPEGLKVTEAQSGTVTDGPLEVGVYEITTAGEIKIEITNAKYLADKNGILKNGTISFYGGFDGDYWNEGGTKEVKIGEFSYDIELEEKEVVASGDLIVEKTVVKDGTDEIRYDNNNNAYIEYLITVTAPAENTKVMESVKVEDTFTAGSKYVKSTEVVQNSQGNISLNTGVWTIGKMNPGSVATLKFRAYLNGSFFYVKNTTNTSSRQVTNKAVVKSQNKYYDEDSVTTTSNWGLNIDKRNSGYSYDEKNNKGTVTYTVTVTAPRTNAETIRNVSVYDAFGGTNNVKGYVVKYDTVSKPDGTTYVENNTDKTLLWNIGDMAPGTVKELEYTVEIDSDIFNDGKGGTVERTLPNTATLKVNGKDVGSDNSEVSFKKEWIKKHGQIDYSDDRIKFVIYVNKSEEGTPELGGKLTVTDELSGEWEYDGAVTVKQYWVENGITRENKWTFTPNGTDRKSWEIEVDGGYYYEFEYYVKSVGAKIGEASISNKAGVGIGVGNDNYYHETTWQGTGRYYDSLAKEFVSANGDIATWTSIIKSNIPAGTRYYDYRLANRGYEWSITDKQIADVIVKKGDQVLEKGVDYTASRAGYGADRFEIIFLNDVDGVTAESPITITYDTTLNTNGLKPSQSREFVNNAMLEIGESRAYADANYIYYKDQKLTKTAGEFNSETGELEWFIRVNQTGSMSGDAILTEYLPEGLKFTKAEISEQGGSASIESVTVNDDNTVTIRLNGLEASGDTSRYVEIRVLTELTDKDLLLTNFSKEFVNYVELNYDGDITSSNAQVTVKNTTLTKEGVYNESTAPYIEYTIHVNPEGNDMLKDEKYITVVDEMGKNMMLKSDSLKIVGKNGKKYDPIELEIDENVFSFKVPDDEPLTITYKAYVQGEVGEDVTVTNKVSYFGDAAVPGIETENKVKVAKSMATIEGGTGFYVVKRDAHNSSVLLKGTEYTLYEVGTDAVKTEVADDNGIVTFYEVQGTDDEEPRALSDNHIYAFKETKAADGYLIDETNKKLTYVAFKRSVVEAAIEDKILPAGIDVDDVIIIQSGVAFERKNEKNVDTSIKFSGKKTLENANYDLEAGTYYFNISGPNLRDADGNAVDSLTVTHQADGTIDFPEIVYELKDLGGATEKEFHYEISEQPGDVSGITYSKEQYDVTVKVVKNNDGTLKAYVTKVTDKDGKPVEGKGSSIFFTNTYAAEKTAIIEGTKSAEGMQVREGDFSFTLTETTDGISKTIATVTNDGSGKFTFNLPTYTAEDHNKVFTYTIHEENTGKDGIIYDETIYDVSIKVIDKNNGELELEKKITVGKGFNKKTVDKVVFSNHFEGGVELTKTNGKTGDAKKQLEGAEFDLFKAESGNKWIYQDTYTTGENGKLEVNGLAEGSYYLVESKAPAGYKIIVDENGEAVKHPFEIGPHGNGAVVKATIEVGNEQKLGTLSLFKSDVENAAAIQGAVFDLYKDGVLYQADMTTGEDGKISISGLPWGEYYFVETAPAPGYVLDKTPTDKVIINAEYVDGVPVTVAKTNEKIDGSLRLIKSDAENAAAIKGAVFDLYKDGKVYKSELTTDADGVINIEGLPWGEYYFVETAPAPGYVLDATPTEKVVIDAKYVEGDPVTVIKTNEKKVGTLSLLKSDAENAVAIEGAVFDLYKDGKVYRSGLKTNEEGMITIGGLLWGEYYFVETTSAPGYVLDATPTEKVVINAEYVEGDPVIVKKTNEKKTGTLSLFKSDAENKAAIEGAEFNLYKDGVVYKEGLVTDAEGKIEVNNLPWGEYYFVETASAPGYVLDTTPTDKVVINANYVDGAPVTVDKANEKQLGNLSLIKKDVDTAEVIGGAVFDLYKDGKVYKTELTTDAEGKIEVKDLPWGEYYFVETTPAPGYVLDATPTEKVVINAEYVEGDPATVEKTNAQTEFYIAKTDINGEKHLKGATIEIFKVVDGDVARSDEANLTRITSWTSDGSNHLIKGMLDVGATYIIKETAAPTGYGLLESYIEFTVNEDGSIVSKANFAIDENGNRVLLVQDDTIKLKVTKIDYVTGKNLEGAVLAVFDKETGEEIVRWTSTKDGHYDFGAHLEANKTYILKELQAPEGYSKIDDVEFNVLNEGQIEVVTESEYVTYEDGMMEIGNCPVPPNGPETGDYTPLGMYMILMTLAMIGMVAAAIPRRRRNN